jgi:hypothetical protein
MLDSRDTQEQGTTLEFHKNVVLMDHDIANQTAIVVAYAQS